MNALTKISNETTYLAYKGHESLKHAAEHAGDHGGHGDTLGEVLIHHVQNSMEWELFFMKFHLPEFHMFGMDFSISKNVVMMWLAATLLFLVLKVGMKWAGMVPKGVVTGLFEPMIIFVRDEIVNANFGKDHGRKFQPLFLTFFFFILFMNLIGLMPFMATATNNVNTTGPLALITFTMIHMSGIVKHGFFKHWGNFVPHGVPFWLVPVMFPIEIIGTVGKCFALMIRLFASMTAGHLVMFAFLGLIIVMKSAFVSLFSVPVVVIIMGLEIFFAFLQAYIFTFLSALFISMSYHAAH